MKLNNKGTERDQFRLLCQIQKLKLTHPNEFDGLRAALQADIEATNRTLRVTEGPDLHRAQGRAMYLDDLCDILDNVQEKHSRYRESLDGKQNTPS